MCPPLFSDRCDHPHDNDIDVNSLSIRLNFVGHQIDCNSKGKKMRRCQVAKRLICTVLDCNMNNCAVLETGLCMYEHWWKMRDLCPFKAV